MSDIAQSVARAASLFTALRANAAEAEAIRRLPERNIQLIKEAGLFRITVPRHFGGDECNVRRQLEISSELARACGASGWVTMILNASAWVAALFTERAQHEIWGGNPDARVCSVLTGNSVKARRVENGLILSGNWPFASGSLHADWALLGMPLMDDTSQAVGEALSLVPISDLEIKDTWFTAGLRGTGSNTLVAADIFVPDHRVLDVGRAMAGSPASEHAKDAPAYRAAFVPVVALVLVGPALGLARAAMEHFIEAAPRRGILYTWHSKQAEATVAHLQIAEAAMKIDSAHLHAFRAADEIDQWAANDTTPDLRQRARIRADLGHAASLCRDAVNLLLGASGGSSVSETNAMQRIWRDVNTANLHAVVSPATNMELYGRILLGQPPHTTMV